MLNKIQNKVLHGIVHVLFSTLTMRINEGILSIEIMERNWETLVAIASSNYFSLGTSSDFQRIFDKRCYIWRTFSYELWQERCSPLFSLPTWSPHQLKRIQWNGNNLRATRGSMSVPVHVAGIHLELIVCLLVVSIIIPTKQHTRRMLLSGII